MKEFKNWALDNEELLQLLKCHEISIDSVITAKEIILTRGRDADLSLFANLIELAHTREKAIRKNAISFAEDGANKVLCSIIDEKPFPQTNCKFSY